MKANHLIYVVLLLIATHKLTSQNEKDLIKKINFQTVEDIQKQQKVPDSIIIKDFKNHIQIVEKAIKINDATGAIKIGFTGNEAENNSLYVIQSGMEYKSGIYPLNVEANMNIQTQVENGTFNEVVSNIDLSIDYTAENTIHEGYAFVKRTRNTFIGINQRYEIGGGYIANVYSSPMKKGKDIIDAMNTWKKKYPKDILEKNKYYKQLEKTFNNEDIEALFTETEKHKNVAKIKYSRYRLAFLMGINSEIEQTQNDLLLYGTDTTLTHNFNGTNIFRLVLAPKFELRGEKFHWSNTLFAKVRIGGDSDRLVDNSNIITNITNFRESDLNDFWIQFRSSLEFKFSQTLSLVTSLNYIYDNAPKRQFYLDINNNSQLALAEQRYLGTAMTLKYSF